jgi:hypothetical protein
LTDFVAENVCGCLVFSDDWDHFWNNLGPNGPMAEDAQIWELTEMHVASNSRFIFTVWWYVWDLMNAADFSPQLWPKAHAQMI